MLKQILSFALYILYKSTISYCQVETNTCSSNNLINKALMLKQKTPRVHIHPKLPYITNFITTYMPKTQKFVNLFLSIPLKGDMMNPSAIIFE